MPIPIVNEPLHDCMYSRVRYHADVPDIVRKNNQIGFRVYGVLVDSMWIVIFVCEYLHVVYQVEFQNES